MLQLDSRSDRGRRGPLAARLTRVSFSFVVIALAGVTSLAQADGGGDPSRAPIAGRIEVAGEPAPGWRVILREARRSGSRKIDETVSGSEGEFRLRRAGVDRDAVLYVVAKKGSARRLLTVIGRSDEAPANFVVNELATVASVYTAAQFIDGQSIRGNRVGLLAAARNVPNLVDLETGRPGTVVQNVVNGSRTTTLATMNTLASLTADCLVAGCDRFFALSALAGAPPARNTVEALHNVALHPWNNVTEIFALRPPAIDGADDNPVFIPTLLWPPTAWTLSLVYAEGGFNAPGGMSVDGEGNLWTNNNFVPGSQSVLLDVGGVLLPDPNSYAGTGVVKLASNGEAQSPVTGFLGGGTFGAAFGIAIDHRGHALIGNFGGNSVSELAPDGTPISPDSSTAYGSDGGYHDRGFDSPQSLIVDRDGNVWVSNLMGDSVSQMIDGDPRRIRTWGRRGCDTRRQKFASPWGLASDQRGRIWVTNSADNSVSMIDPRRDEPLCPVRRHRLGADPLGVPEGIAVDFDGNVWAAQTGGGSVALLRAADRFRDVQRFDADATAVGPWGIAIDGNNNVWVADFFGKRILNLCGTSGNCPPGMQQTGDRISPPGRPDSGEAGMGGGYGANGALQSITSINIDQAGNVWVANNFDNDEVCLAGAAIPPSGEGSTSGEERLQPMCGGNGAVVVFGIAGPVAAPLIGGPRQP